MRLREQILCYRIGLGSNPDSVAYWLCDVGKSLNLSGLHQQERNGRKSYFRG